MSIPTLKIRQAKISDAAQLFNMFQTNLLEPDLFISDPDKLDYIATEEAKNIKEHRKGDNLYLVAILDKQIVGSIILTVGDYRKNCHSGSFGISIRKEFRHQGIGTKLMTELIKWAKEHKLKRIELEVWANNPGAINLYKKFEFTIEGIKRKAYKVKNKFIDSYLMSRLF